MSMKNRVLLHRAGRDQYGNKGNKLLPTYKPSRDDHKRTSEMRMQHLKMNDDFIQKHGNQWITRFKGMSKKSTWSLLYPNKKPSLATFYSHSRGYATLEDYLIFLLVHHKQWSLSKLGYKRDQIKVILMPFKECGRYMVSYKGGASFSTKI